MARNQSSSELLSKNFFQTDILETPRFEEGPIISYQSEIESIFIQRLTDFNIQKQGSCSEEIMTKITKLVKEQHCFASFYDLFEFVNEENFIICRQDFINIINEEDKLFSYLYTLHFSANDSILESQESEPLYENLALSIRRMILSYGLVAQRFTQTDEKLQRRMDSLARLLQLNSIKSVCLALTIVDRKLYISANYSDKMSDECAKLICNKLKIFRYFIKNLPKDHYDLNTYAEFKDSLDETIEIFIKEIKNQGGSSLADNLLIQATQKLIFSYANLDTEDNRSDKTRDYFTPNEWHAIFENQEVCFIIPSRKNEISPGTPTPKNEKGKKGKPKLKMLHYTVFETSAESMQNESVEMSSKQYDLGEYKEDLSIRYIHCEQLLLYYLNQLSQDNGLSLEFCIFGISKLCCQTCIMAIQEWNNQKPVNQQISVRGCHQEIYDRVINLFNTNKILMSPKKDVEVSTFVNDGLNRGSYQSPSSAKRPIQNVTPTTPVQNKKLKTPTHALQSPNTPYVNEVVLKNPTTIISSKLSFPLSSNQVTNSEELEMNIGRMFIDNIRKGF